MKNKVLFCKSVLISLLLLAFSSCVSHGVHVYQGPADLTITNLTTGSTIRKQSTIIIGAIPEELVLHHGDKIELLFTPPEQYANEKFDVAFQVLGQDYSVSDKPYRLILTIEDNISKGSSYVTCSAMCRIWNQQSSCKQAISIVVVE